MTFPNATRVLLKALRDPELKALFAELADTWQASQEQAVAEERERCALIALTAREGTALGPVTDDGYKQARADIAAAIRSGKDRGCDPPQAEKE